MMTRRETRVQCVFMRGGYCKTHKQKGNKKFEWNKVTVEGDNGRPVTKYRKTTVYVYDLSLTGRGRLRQLELPFTRKTTLEDNLSHEDTA